METVSPSHYPAYDSIVSNRCARRHFRDRFWLVKFVLALGGVLFFTLKGNGASGSAETAKSSASIVGDAPALKLEIDRLVRAGVKGSDRLKPLLNAALSTPETDDDRAFEVEFKKASGIK